MYRKPDRNELTILKRAFDKWGIFDFIEGKAVLINDLGRNKIREVCVLSTKLEAIICQSEPYYAGLKIGELKKNSCRLCRELTL
jgi:hypothetical protein